MKKRSAKLPLMNINRVSFIVASLSLSLIVAVYADDITLAKLDVKTLVSKMTPLKGNTPAQWRVMPAERRQSPGRLLSPEPSTSFTMGLNQEGTKRNSR